jgi:prepilin-type N-terminal cleavage/methylation domain-containing protein
MPGPSPPRHSRPHPHAARRGFTLTELLVVIAIVSALLAITVGGLFHSRTVNRLLATEQLLADFVRQARHAAKSTGAPVVLEIQPINPTDPTLGWTVAGVSRSCVWSDSFDDTAGGTRAQPVITPTLLTSPLSVPASGWTIGANGIGVTGIGANSGISVNHTLRPGEQLVRGNHQDGFYLACALRLVGEQLLPKMALYKQKQQGGGGGALMAIPLMLIGAAGDDAVSSSLGGMMLLQTLRKEQPTPSSPPATFGTPPPPVAPAPALSTPPMQPYLNSFELIGWAAPYNPGGLPPPEAINEVSSIQEDSHPLMTDPGNPLNSLQVWRDQPVLHPSFSAMSNDLDVATPIGVDQWIEVGLLFDGANLTLYRNGRCVGERAYQGPANGLPAGKDTIFIGQASVPGPGPVYSGSYAVFDDVRLYRMGTEQLGRLPSGVVASQPFRITAHPDGRIELGANAMVQVAVRGGNSVTVVTPGRTTEAVTVVTRAGIILSLQPHGQPAHDHGALTAAVLTFSSSGQVTSSLATWEADTDGTAEYPVLATP